MTTTWSFYHSVTGIIHTGTFTGPERALIDNTPAGHVPIEGRYDLENQRVDVDSGAVVDYVPPQPDDDHAWNATSRRWELKPEVIAAAAADEQARSQIAQLEASQLRPLRELALDPTSKTARDKLAAIDTQIAEQRLALAPSRAVA